MCGFLAVECAAGDMVTVHAQHTLTNMVIGFMSGKMERPVARVITCNAPVFIETVAM